MGPSAALFMSSRAARTRIALGVVLGLLSTLLASFEAPASAATAPTGTIVFTRHDAATGVEKAFAESLDGETWRLTSGHEVETAASLSPDGKKVAVVTNCQGCHISHKVSVYDLYAEQPKWSRLVSGVDPSFTEFVDWSPGGTKLAVAATVTSGASPGTKVFVMPADGSAAGTPLLSRPLVQGEPTIRIVRWSPNGDRIGFSRTYGSPNAMDFGTVDVADGTWRILEYVPATWATQNFGWADNNHMLYGHSVLDFNTNSWASADLRKAAADGTTPPTTVYEEPPGKRFHLRTVSADGQWFVSEPSAPLKITPVDGSEASKTFTSTMTNSSGVDISWFQPTLLPPGTVVPAITASGVTGPVNLGDPIGFDARSADGSATDVSIDWGDGTVEVKALTGGTSNTHFTHEYAGAGTKTIKVTALGENDSEGNEVDLTAYVFDVQMTVTPSSAKVGQKATVDLTGSTMPLTAKGVRLEGAGDPTPLTSNSLSFDVTFTSAETGDLSGFLVFDDPYGDGDAEVGPATKTVSVAEGVAGTLVFSRHDPDSGGMKAYASSMDGDSWRLTDGDFFAERAASLSPDGTKVAVVHDCITSCSNGGRVAVYDLYASQPNWVRAPLATQSHAYGLDWSPDGDSLAVAAGVPGAITLSVMPADGSAPGTRLATFPNANPMRVVRWSPDGKKIAYSRINPNTNGSIFEVLDVASKAISVRATTVQGWAGYNFEWTPDGSALLYGDAANTGPSQFTPSALKRVNATGTPSTTTIYQDPENKMFVLRTISPDGKWFVSGRNSTLELRRVADPSAPAELFPETISQAGREVTWELVDVEPPPNPHFETSGLNPYVNVGSTLNFQAQSYDGTSRKVEVNWGDGSVQKFALAGSPQTPTNLEHVYTTPGTHTVKVTGLGPGGRRGTVKELTVHVFDIKVNVTPSTLVAGDSATIDFAGSTLPVAPTGVTISHGADPSPSESDEMTFETTFNGTGKGDLQAFLTVQGEGGTHQVGPGRAFVAVNPPSPGPGGLLTESAGDLFVYPDVNDPSSFWQITFGAPYDLQPAFDETGRRVVFQRDGDIWMVDNDGRNLRRLTNTPELEAFPDLHGDTVVYTRYPPHGPSPAVLMRADIDTPSARSVVPVETSASFGYLEFTPGGKAVRYTDVTSLRRVSLGGGGDTVQYKSTNAIYYPDWSADGSKALVQTNGNIVEIDLATGTKRTVTNRADNAVTDSLTTPVYSPNGERVAYSAWIAGAGPQVRTLPLVGGTHLPFDNGNVGDWWVGGSEDEDPVFIVTDPGTGTPIDNGCNPAPGECTLPEAIVDHNTSSNDTESTIIVPPGTRIDPTTPLPPITKPGTVTGDVEPGDDYDPHQDGCGIPSILVGDKAGSGAVGLSINVGRQAARTTLIRGFNIVRFRGDGLRVHNSAKVRLRCVSSGAGALGFPQPEDANRGDGFDVKDSLDVVLYPSTGAAWNGSDGLEVTGNSRRVRSLGTSFSDNRGLGIDLGKDGVNANDAGDADVGPNGLVNRPTILRVRPTQTPFQDRIFLKVNHDSVERPFRVDVFLNAWCDASGSGEAIQWLGAGMYAGGTTNAKRLVRVDLPFDVPTYLLTASVTTGSGTSELSGCRHRDTDADPETDGTGATGPTSTITPGSGGPGGGGSDTSNGGGDVGDNGFTDGGPGSTTDGDDDGGNDDVSRGDEPDPDTTPNPDGYVVVGQTGQVTVDKPGLLDGLAGDGPLQAIKETGGDMPVGKWSLAANGVVTMDATSLAPGTYYGRYSVVDRDGDRVGPAVIIFVVLNDKGSVVGTKDDPPKKAKPRPDTYVVEPGREYAFAGKNSVLSNDWRGSESNLTSALVSPGPLGGGKVKVLGDGTSKLNMNGVAEGTYQATYRLRAGGKDRGTTTITIVVDNHNACPIARDDPYEIVAGDILKVPASRGALSNDSDPENGAFTAKLIGSFGPNDIDFGKDGSIYLDARKASQVKPTHREFSYRAVDSHGESCGQATVRIDITPNQAPTANLNHYKVFKGQNFAMPARGVLGNDFDIDGPETALTAKKKPGSGPAGVASDGSVSFSVPANAPIDKIYTTRYFVTDALGASAEGQIRFLVVPKGQHDPVPQPPVVKDDLFYRVHADGALLITASNGVLANDTDPDGEGLFAEGLSEGEGRFQIDREGRFSFRPRLADVGATFTQKYYAVKKGYSGVRSKNVATVSIQVVAPRVRCTSASQGVDLKAYDDGSNPSTLVDGTADWTFCWDKTNITDGWFDKPADPITYDTSSALGVADTVFVGFKVKGVSNSQKTAFDRFPQQKRAEMSVSTEYNMCFDGAEFMTAAVGGLAKAFETPIIGKAIQSLAKRFDDKLPQKILDLIVATRKKLDGIPGGGFAAAAIEKLPWVGAIFKNVNSHEGKMRKVLKFIENQTVKVAYDKSGVGKFTGRLSLAGIVNLIAEKGLSFGDLKIFAESFSCGTFMQELFDSYAPASGTSKVDVRADGKVKPRTAAIDGPYGFFEWFANWVWLFDLTRNGDVELAWEPKELEDGGTLYRTCDFTRTSAGDKPTPADKIPGKPLVPCTDPSRRS